MSFFSFLFENFAQTQAQHHQQKSTTSSPTTAIQILSEFQKQFFFLFFVHVCNNFSPLFILLLFKKKFRSSSTVHRSSHLQNFKRPELQRPFQLPFHIQSKPSVLLLAHTFRSPSRIHLPFYLPQKLPLLEYTNTNTPILRNFNSKYHLISSKFHRISCTYHRISSKYYHNLSKYHRILSKYHRISSKYHWTLFTHIRISLRFHVNFNAIQRNNTVANSNTKVFLATLTPCHPNNSSQSWPKVSKPSYKQSKKSPNYKPNSQTKPNKVPNNTKNS